MREKEMIPTHLDVSYVDIVQFTYFNDADDDAPYGLSDNFDDVDGLCDVVDGPLFSRFRTRTDVFGQVDGMLCVMCVVLCQRAHKKKL